MTKLTVILCLVLMTIYIYGGCEGTRELWDHLFVSNSYNKHVRPTEIWENPTRVNFSFSIIAVIEFDEVKETITVTGKLTLSWIDDFLHWNPALFSNISRIRVAQTEVWKPYIVLDNSVTGLSELGTPLLEVLIDSTGRVEWKPIQIFQTTCPAYVQKFPFDTQICTMIFEAAGYARTEVEITPVIDHLEFHEYSGTSGWKITETKLAVVEEDGEYHTVCSIKMNRNPVYFLLNIFLPISLLSFLNICVFILPVESGEKASFVVTVFLSLAVFLTIVSGKLPENSESIAYLNIYVFINTLLSTGIAVVNIILIRIYNRDPDIPMSWFLVQVALFFSSTEIHREPCVDNDDEFSRNGETKVVSINITTHGDDETKLFELKDDGSNPTESLGMKNMEKKTEMANVSWKRLVQALDYVCFVVFLVINLTTTIVILAVATKYEQADFADIETHA